MGDILVGPSLGLLKAMHRAPYISPENITPTKGYSPFMGQKVMFKTAKMGNMAMGQNPEHPNQH